MGRTSIKIKGVQVNARTANKQTSNEFPAFANTKTIAAFSIIPHMPAFWALGYIGLFDAAHFQKK
ncbi:MAG: hypothetical protein ABJB11_24835 [Ferruginibacter sp.]